MKLKLPDSVSSSQDLTSLLLEVQEYERWFAHESIKKRVNADAASQAPVVSPATSEVLRQWKLKNALSPQSLDQLVKALHEYRETAPSITLTLAAPPTNGIKVALVAWCRAKIAPDVLINFQFNSTLLGGMVVRSGSHVFDWSFRRQILDGRHRFPEILRHV